MVALFETGKHDIPQDRWSPMFYQIEFKDIDLTGATFAMQVRDSKDGGTLRANLTTTGTPGAEGVRLVSSGASGSVIEMVILEATMEAMDVANDAGQLGSDGLAWWGLHITPSGGTKFLALEGQFTVKAGAVN